MRVTYRGSRNYKSNKHNDRKFNITKATHIDAEREKNNMYWHIYKYKQGYPKMTFEQAELEYYKKAFSKHLEHQNAKHIARRQYKRCRTIEDIYKNKNTKPEEFILQIGNKDNFPNKQVLGEAWSELFTKLDKWNIEHGEPFALLNFALHGDETTPHLHGRRVWQAQDPETGLTIPHQDLALDQAGIPLPYPDRPKSRKNNRKITFDKMVRGWWQDICISKGLDIETEPLPARKHKGKEEYINDQIQAKQEELERLTSNVKLAKRLEKELSKIDR